MSEKLSQLRLELKDSHEVDILFKIYFLSRTFNVCWLEELILQVELEEKIEIFTFTMEKNFV